ncbi:MAG: DnaJ C-terminal domain-containing protein [Chthonomonadales bacterium]
MPQPEYKDYYKILGVPKTADEREIKVAYRRLARKYHPDVNPGDETAEAKFKEISEANEVLSDAEKRAKYDQFGDQWKAYSGPQPQGGWQTGQQGFSGGDFQDFGSLQDMFETFFGGKVRTERQDTTGEDIEFALELSLEEAVRGGERVQNFNLEDMCPACDGSGQARDPKGRFILRGVCPECKGRGRVKVARQVTVKIPAGISEGKRLRLAGQGAAGSTGRRGDLYLRIVIKPHALFTRLGDDIYADINVPFTVAALGGDAHVDTIGGLKTLNIPAGVQSGQKIRIAGQGSPTSDGKKKGDFYAVVRITVPKQLSDREREILKEFAASRKDPIRS